MGAIRGAASSVITTAISLGCLRVAAPAPCGPLLFAVSPHPPAFLSAMCRAAPAAACPRRATALGGRASFLPAAEQRGVGSSGAGFGRSLAMQASGSESVKKGGGARRTDWRNGRGGRRGRGGGGRGPPALTEAELAGVQDLEGVQALLSEGMKVVVLAPGKARLFYEGNPVVFGGAVGAVFGEPAPGDKVTVTDHRGKEVGWGVYNPDSMYRVRMLWLCSIDGHSGSLRDVAGTLTKRLASAGLSLEHACMRKVQKHAHAAA
jgi:hypothetical protein